MEWELLLSAFAGLLTGGGVSWLFKLREDKAGSQADAIDKAADAMKKLLDNTEQQQTTFNKIIEGYKIALDEANKKLKEFEYKVADNDRKMAGMQKMIDTAINDRRIAENMACYDEKCNQRKTKKDN